MKIMSNLLILMRGVHRHKGEVREGMQFSKKAARDSAARAVVRGLCLAAALLALIALGMQITQGVTAVVRGDQSVAQMLSALGAWLRGE